MFNLKLSLTFFILFSALTGCAGINSTSHTSDELLDFAESNCLFWYFKSKGYDTSDISKVTAGIVEMSSYSADKFQKTAFLIKEYSPVIPSKGNIDINLSKCFILEKDEKFLVELDIIRKL